MESTYRSGNDQTHLRQLKSHSDKPKNVRMILEVFYKNLSCDIFEIEGGPMKVGTSVVEEVTVYKIQIDGRGGDSIDDEYYLEMGDAILAGAVDGTNHPIRTETILKLSDGTYIGQPRGIRISLRPSKEDVARAVAKLPQGTQALVRDDR